MEHPSTSRPAGPVSAKVIITSSAATDLPIRAGRSLPTTADMAFPDHIVSQ